MFTVYRCFDAEDQLLYVGCTHDVEQRIRAHRASSAFGWRIARITTDTYPTKDDALAVERLAIRDEAPLFNVMGRFGDRSDWTLEHYRSFIAACEPRATSDIVRRRIERLRAESAARFGEVAA